MQCMAKSHQKTDLKSTMKEDESVALASEYHFILSTSLWHIKYTDIKDLKEQFDEYDAWNFPLIPCVVIQPRQLCTSVCFPRLI